MTSLLTYRRAVQSHLSESSNRSGHYCCGATEIDALCNSAGAKLLINIDHMDERQKVSLIHAVIVRCCGDHDLAIDCAAMALQSMRPIDGASACVDCGEDDDTILSEDEAKEVLGEQTVCGEAVAS